jgi:hypothetical protein
VSYLLLSDQPGGNAAAIATSSVFVTVITEDQGYLYAADVRPERHFRNRKQIRQMLDLVRSPEVAIKAPRPV